MDQLAAIHLAIHRASIALLVRWTWIVAVVSVGTLLWRVTVLQWFVSYRLATFGAYLVRLKWVVCPLMAYPIWKQGNWVVAVLALPWPLIVFVLQNLLAIVQGVLGGFFPVAKPERTMWVGPVQERFMIALRYSRRIETLDRDIRI